MWYKRRLGNRTDEYVCRRVLLERELRLFFQDVLYFSQTLGALNFYNILFFLKITPVLSLVPEMLNLTRLSNARLDCTAALYRYEARFHSVSVALCVRQKCCVVQLMPIVLQ